MPGDDAIKDAAGKAAKEAKALAKDGAAIARAFIGDFSGLWSVFKRWGGRILKLGLIIIVVMIQMWAASVTANAQCGYQPESDAKPEYDGGGTGAGPANAATSGKGPTGEDMSIVSKYYAELKRRYGNDPDGNRVLLATFETALAESRFNNLKGGDRDSVGVFQQRPSSGWGSPAQINDLDYTLDKYLAKLESERKGSGANLKAHQLAQEVQFSHCRKNNPENHPDCYAPGTKTPTWGGNYLDEEKNARNLIEGQGGFFPTGGNEHGGNTLNASGTDEVVEAGADACEGAYGNIDMEGAVDNYKIVDKLSGEEFTLDLLPGGQRGETIKQSFSQMGVPYVFGGNDWAEAPNDSGGLDCSALVLGALKRGADIKLTHQSKAQFAEMKSTTVQDRKAIKATQGDVLFFSYGGTGGIHHVGIYLGMGSDSNGNRMPLMMHTANTRDDARIQKVWDHENVWSGDPGYKSVAADFDATAATGSGEVVSPLKPGSYDYQPKAHKFGGGHDGIDMMIKPNQPIYAVADGIVIVAGCNASDGCKSQSNGAQEGPVTGAGYWVKIYHPNGEFNSSYFHMVKAPSVAKTKDGKPWQVKKGDVIGYTGSSGGSGAPHLHFEIRKPPTKSGSGGKPIDPVPFMKSKGVVIK
jgi:cell wall-associated NlpC family hydrolase